MFLYFFVLIRFIIFFIDFIVLVLRLCIWFNLGFFGDVFLDRRGGWGVGVNEILRNDEINLVIDWFVVNGVGFCLECCLCGFIVFSDEVFEDFCIVVFLGDVNGNCWDFVDCIIMVVMIILIICCKKMKSKKNKYIGVYGMI